MVENKDGISSINKRLRKLESQTFIEKDDDDLIEILQRKQKQNKKNKLNELNEIYLTNLYNNLSEINKDNFLNVLKFTIEFVDENINQISIVLQTKISEDLKDIVCIDFINRLYTGEFSEIFLENSTKTMRILLNTEKTTGKCCDNENCQCLNCGCKKDKKKGFFKK